MVPVFHGYTTLILPARIVGTHAIMAQFQPSYSRGPNIFLGRSLELVPWTPFTNMCLLMPLSVSPFSRRCLDFLCSWKVLRRDGMIHTTPTGEVLSLVSAAEWTVVNKWTVLLVLSGCSYDPKTESVNTFELTCNTIGLLIPFLAWRPHLLIPSKNISVCSLSYLSIIYLSIYLSII